MLVQGKHLLEDAIGCPGAELYMWHEICLVLK
jgi:hypothetical protein